MARLKKRLKSPIIWIGFMYRDASNHKTFFVSPININEYRRVMGTNPKIGDELEMEDVGINPETVWELSGGYNDYYDHTIIKIIEIFSDETLNGEKWNIIYPEDYDENTELINEVLTKDDVARINTMIWSKAKQIAQDEVKKLEKDIKTKQRQQDDNNKKYDSHLKDTGHHLDDKAVEKIAKDNDKQLETDLEKMVKSELEKIYKDKNFEKSVQNIVTDTLVSFYKTMWVKRGFWQNSLLK